MAVQARTHCLDDFGDPPAVVGSGDRQPGYLAFQVGFLVRTDVYKRQLLLRGLDDPDFRQPVLESLRHHDGPLGMELDGFTVAAQIVNFLILVWLLKRFLYGRCINHGPVSYTYLLLLIDNIFRFIQAGAEVSGLMGRMPSRVGYQPVSYTHLDVYKRQKLSRD